MTEAETLARLEKALASVRRWKEDDDSDRNELWALQRMLDLYDGIVALGLVELKRKQMEGKS